MERVLHSWGVCPRACLCVCVCMQSVGVFAGVMIIKERFTGLTAGKTKNIQEKYKYRR